MHALLALCLAAAAPLPVAHPSHGLAIRGTTLSEWVDEILGRVVLGKSRPKSLAKQFGRDGERPYVQGFTTTVYGFPPREYRLPWSHDAAKLYAYVDGVVYAVVVARVVKPHAVATRADVHRAVSNGQQPVIEGAAGQIREVYCEVAGHPELRAGFIYNSGEGTDPANLPLDEVELFAAGRLNDPCPAAAR